MSLLHMWWRCNRPGRLKQRDDGSNGDTFWLLISRGVPWQTGAWLDGLQPSLTDCLEEFPDY